MRDVHRHKNTHTTTSGGSSEAQPNVEFRPVNRGSVTRVTMSWINPISMSPRCNNKIHRHGTDRIPGLRWCVVTPAVIRHSAYGKRTARAIPQQRLPTPHTNGRTYNQATRCMTQSLVPPYRLSLRVVVEAVWAGHGAGGCLGWHHPGLDVLHRDQRAPCFGACRAVCGARGTTPVAA